MKEDFLEQLKLALDAANFPKEKTTAVISKYAGKINRMLADGMTIENVIASLGKIDDIVIKEKNPLLGKNKNQILLVDFGIILPCSLIGFILMIALAFCSITFGIASVMYCIKAWSFPDSQQLAVFVLAMLFLLTCIAGVYATYVCVKKIILYIINHINNRTLALRDLTSKYYI